MKKKKGAVAIGDRNNGHSGCAHDMVDTGRGHWVFTTNNLIGTTQWPVGARTMLKLTSYSTMNWSTGLVRANLIDAPPVQTITVQ